MEGAKNVLKSSHNKMLLWKFNLDNCSWKDVSYNQNLETFYCYARAEEEEAQLEMKMVAREIPEGKTAHSDSFILIIQQIVTKVIHFLFKMHIKLFSSHVS